MSKHIPASAFRVAAPPETIDAIGTAAAPTQPTAVLRSFDLPTRLFAATVGLYFAFLGIMAATFADPGLVIPMAIFTIYIVMAFGVPALWVTMKPDHAAKPLSWPRFVAEGIATHTGRMAARDAATQVLMLPLLILCWGLVVAAIVASL